MIGQLRPLKFLFIRQDIWREKMDVHRCKIVVCLSKGSFGQVREVIEQFKAHSLWERSHYFALVTDISKDAVPFNMWLNIGSVPLTTPTRSSIARHMTPDELLGSLESDVLVKDMRQELIANEIHWLLDHLPWNSEHCALVDVIALVPEHPLSPSVDIYGALLRLRTWNNASVYLIPTSEILYCRESNEDTLTWNDLSMDLPAYLGPLSLELVQTLSSNILWKGPVCIPEHRNKANPSPPSLTLPGFSMAMDEEGNSPRQLFPAVGMDIDHTQCSSHLEMVQVVDVRDIPPIWISPLTVKLSIDPPYNDHTPSSHLFQQLFHSTGVLLKLFMKGASNESERSEHTTSQWRLHVLEKEVSPGDRPTSATATSLSDYPGPLLLVLPQSSGSVPGNPKSCDARLLWKPQTMLYVGGTFKRLFLQSMEHVITDGGDSSVHQNISREKGDMFYNKDMLLDDLRKQETFESSTCSEEIALQTLEAIMRKQIKRKHTSELMLGGVVAPPPNISSASLPTTTDLLDCFTDNGMPILDLSPVPMGSVNEAGGIRHMIDPSGLPSCISYETVLDCTPTTARKYHGVSYCLNDHDTDTDSKLMKIQERFISSERSSNCSNCPTPVKNTELKNKKKLDKVKSKSTKSKTTIVQDQSHTGPQSVSKESCSSKRSKYLNQKKAPCLKLSDVNYRSLSTTKPNITSERKLGKRTIKRIASPPLKKKITKYFRSTTNEAQDMSTKDNRENHLVDHSLNRRHSLPNTNLCSDKERNGLLKDGFFEKTYSRLRVSKARRSLNIEEGIETSCSSKHSVSPPATNNDFMTVESAESSDSLLSIEAMAISEPSPLRIKRHAASSTSCDTTSSRNSLHVASSISCDSSGTIKPTPVDSKKPLSNYKLRKLLEGSIIASLKRNNLKPGHQHFKSCYVRLFKICKVFVKDLKGRSCESLKEQVNKIVDFNVRQVIDFELTS